MAHGKTPFKFNPDHIERVKQRAQTMTPEHMPDLIVASSVKELSRYITAYGWKIIGEFPNTRPGFRKVRVSREEQTEAVLVGERDSIRITDVKGKVVCGNIPLWMAMHALIVVVLEPAVSPMFHDSFTLGDESKPQTQWRLAAYDVFRKAANYA